MPVTWKIVRNQEIRGNMTIWKGITIAATKTRNITWEVFVFVLTSTHPAIPGKIVTASREKPVISTEEKKEEDSLFDAMHDTVQNTGAALFGSAVTTMGAFGILSTSEILPLAQFGFITAMAIGYSFLVAVFVLPSALMVWAKCCKTEEETKKEDIPVLKKKH